MKAIFFIVTLLLLSNIAAEPRVRPDNWATSIIGTPLENIHRVDKGLYRSSQPMPEHIADIKALDIREILNLRYFHNNNGEISNANFKLHRVPMNTFSVTEDDIIQALRIIKNRQGPMLVHCWHGSDRTGTTIAAYRMVFNNWSKEQALDEMINGGFGYHSSIFPNLVELIEQLNIFEIRKKLGLPLK